jgi:hypothetical protein
VADATPPPHPLLLPALLGTAPATAPLPPLLLRSVRLAAAAAAAADSALAAVSELAAVVSAAAAAAEGALEVVGVLERPNGGERARRTLACGVEFNCRSTIFGKSTELVGSGGTAGTPVRAAPPPVLSPMSPMPTPLPSPSQPAPCR